MKTPRSTKRDRRATRKAADRRSRRARSDDTPVGAGSPGGELLERLVEAVTRLGPDAPWSAVAARILPVLRRLHQPFPIDAAPWHVQALPGVWTGFAIDLGPFYTHITRPMVDRWEVDGSTIFRTALDNLATVVGSEPPIVETIRPDGIETTVIQGQGWGSSLILAPDLLGPILGPDPRLLLTPVRNTLVALPDDVDLEFSIRMWQAIAEGSRDELDTEPVAWTGATVVALRDVASTRVH